MLSNLKYCDYAENLKFKKISKNFTLKLCLPEIYQSQYFIFLKYCILTEMSSWLQNTGKQVLRYFSSVFSFRKIKG